MRPRKHCALLLLIGRLKRFKTGSYLRFVRVRRPMHLRTTIRLSNVRTLASYVVAFNVQQVYLTPLLECNTPAARAVMFRELLEAEVNVRATPSSPGIIAPVKLP